MRNRRIGTAATAALALVASGCATKKYVEGETTEIRARIDGVVTQVEDAQTKLRDHEGRIVKNAEATVAASRTAQEALDRAIAAGKLAEGKFLSETVLADDKVKFAVDQAELSPDAKTALDGFADKLRADNQNVYIEIQGHTDNVGGDDLNMRLSAQRADAVRDVLVEKGVAKNRLISKGYGNTKPVESNDTEAGRAKNRRVQFEIVEVQAAETK
jgi:outer membrane protein OmpA-like peptidoglycan-associated protein